MGQRVFPQRNLEPLHRTQRLLCEARVTIWLSPLAEVPLLFMWLSNQLSGALALGGLDCSVMVFFEDGCNGFICFPHGKGSKRTGFSAKKQASSDAKLSKTAPKLRGSYL